MEGQSKREGGAALKQVLRREPRRLRQRRGMRERLGEPRCRCRRRQVRRHTGRRRGSHVREHCWRVSAHGRPLRLGGAQVPRRSEPALAIVSVAIAAAAAAKRWLRVCIYEMSTLYQKECVLMNMLESASKHESTASAAGSSGSTPVQQPALSPSSTIRSSVARHSPAGVALHSAGTIPACCGCDGDSHHAHLASAARPSRVPAGAPV
jgi:hypothetical protein